ncbi:MAG: Sua5/YciO/YrdC/YwlC family protein, partial [Oscillospiraceae bacterium]|nr:Sua5/YciO/YrdC/YwlC family protein [Oscillospiraceae bacterium]
SANLSGMPSPKDAQGVMDYFDGKIPCVVDGGACAVGVESTVLLMTVTPPKVLRAGGLSAERIKAETGIEVEL